MKRKKAIIVAVGVAAAFIVTGKAFISGTDLPNSEQEKQKEASMERKMSDINMTQGISAVFEESTDYESFELSGTSPLIVEEVYISSGSEVTTGSAVMKVTQSSYNQVLSELKKALRQAKSNYQTAKLNYDIDLLSLKSTYSKDLSAKELADESYNNTIEALDLKVSQAKEAYEAAEDIVTNYPDKIEALQQSKENKCAAKKRLAQRVKKVTKSYNTIKKNYEKREQTLNMLSAELEGLRAVQKYVDEYGRSNQRAGELLFELSEKTAKDLQKVEKKYNNAKTKYENVKKKLEQKQIKLQEKETSLSEVKNKIQNLKTQINTYKETLSDTKKQINSLEIIYKQAVSSKETESIAAKSEYEQDCVTTEAASVSYQLEKQELNNTLKAAKDTYKTAKANLKMLKKSFKDYVWYAQSNGTVNYIGYEQGSYITESTPILGYQNDKVLYADFTVDQSEISDFVVGNTIAVQGRFSREGVNGTITEITSDENTGNTMKVTYTVTISIDNSQNIASAGDTAMISISEEQKEVNQ